MTRDPKLVSAIRQNNCLYSSRYGNPDLGFRTFLPVRLAVTP